MPKKTATITLSPDTNRLLKIIEAQRNLGSRSATIDYLAIKEASQNPTLYGSLGKKTN